MFCSIHNFTFLMTHKNLRINLFWVFRKKETFASAIFGKIYIACTVNSAGKLICQHAWLHNSVLQGISPTLKYWPHLFSRRSPQKILNPSDPPPPPCPALHFMSNHPQNFGGISPSPLKCTLTQKSKDSFFKETKYFISNNEIRTHLNVEIWI